MARADGVDLRRVHKHALDLGGLVGAAQPALDAAIAAPATAGAVQKRRQIAGGKAHQRVGAVVQRGDHHLADIAIGHQLAPCQA